MRDTPEGTFRRVSRQRLYSRRLGVLRIFCNERHNFIQRIGIAGQHHDAIKPKGASA